MYDYEEEEIDYSRGGKSLLCIPVDLFNRMIKHGTLVERKLSAPFFYFTNLDGSLKKTGYVAFTSACACLGKSKKSALAKYKENFI